MNVKRLSSPEILREMQRDLLVAWLQPAGAYLATRGLFLPGPTSTEPPDYEKLGRIFMEPGPDMPATLLDSLFLIQAMANPAGMDVLLEGAELNSLSLDLPETATPADVAVTMWLLDPPLLENLHHCHEMTQLRAFRYYSTDVEPLPEFTGPTAEQIAALEERLNAFYVAWKRGRGAKVFTYRHPTPTNKPLCEWWFLVRHGAPCRREGAMQEGEPTTIFYRPQNYDLLVYDVTRGEMRVNCCTEKERRFLLRLFGRCLFGRPDFFPGTAKYTLAPLVRRGRNCLACADVPGIEKVNLTEVEFYFRKEPWKRVIQKASDIFELVERAEVCWPEKIEDITRATFEVKLWRNKKPRRVTIVPCNKALYGRHDECVVLERWLEAREFVLQSRPPSCVLSSKSEKPPMNTDEHK